MSHDAHRRRQDGPVRGAPNADGRPAGGPGKQTLVEQIDTPPVQRRVAGTDQAPGARVHDAAARGVASPTSLLPFSDTIQRAFGRHDVSSIQAHTGPEAAASAGDMGAAAYATGHHVVLGHSASDLHTVAHEAAHVVQQRGGVQPSDGVGRPGDAYERHADQVADHVVAGRSAEHLLDHMVSGSAVAGPAPVQRDVENATYDPDPTKTAQAELARAFFDAYNTEAQKAYEFAVSVPSLGAYASLDGRTELWVEKWQQHLAGKAPKLMAAAFGYVIESLVTDTRSEFCPKAPSSCSVLPQMTSGGTRPDLVLVLRNGSTQVAWLDLTASGSADHIFAKEGWAKKISNFAEVTYPSLDLGTLALMKQNKDNKGALSQEEFERRKAAAHAEHALLKQHWCTVGQQFTIKALGKEARESGATNEMIGLQPGRGQDFIRQKLNAAFGTTLDNKLVPSVLAAMGVNAGPWGYGTGTSQSEKAGEAWLIDNCPLPSSDASDGSSRLPPPDGSGGSSGMETG
jgi:hypothetical protein